ncbi:U3-containing 90S pre-ribosomal complex subunit-domain containing protein [Lipomyces arxii]|uniref:U3-containing 90S pre-ribosomal complex subunit-domain containing protein n=1 Tax=Lipomyces arxii TaxID=56418 RepID=UPI0034CFD1E1
MNTGADDLDDGLEYAVDSDVPVSEDETQQVQQINQVKPDNDKRKKRKAQMAEKKRKRMETELTVKKSLAKLHPDIIADYIARKARIWHPKLSHVELDDAYLISSQRILDTTAWDKTRTLDTFAGFLRMTTAAAPADLTVASELKSAPYVVVISISAIRVCDLRRAVPKSITAIKLIAKNNLAKDTSFLQSATPAVLLCTPERLKSLLDKDALNLTNLTTVVIDCSFLDPKSRSVLDDVPDTVTVAKRLVSSSAAHVALF